MKKQSLLSGYDLNGKPKEQKKQTKQAKQTKRKKQVKPKKETFLPVAYRISGEMRDQIKAIAYFQRKDISELVREILGTYIKKKFTQEVKDLWGDR